MYVIVFVRHTESVNSFLLFGKMLNLGDIAGSSVLLENVYR